MLKFNFISRSIVAVLVAFSFVSCNKDANSGSESSEGYTTLTLGVSDGHATKASTAVMGSYETNVETVEYTLYQGGNPIYTVNWTKGGAAATVRVLSGAYTVCAHVNGCSTSTNLDENVDASGTPLFAMYGEKSVTVSGSSQSVNIDVTRAVNRVVLASVTNNSSYTINYVGVMLTNCPAWFDCQSGSLRDSDSDSWVNKRGRASDGTTKIISSSQCSNPDLLWQDLSGTTYNGGSLPLYCFPNGNSDSEDDTWSPRNTKCVLITTIGGEYNYYVVPLGAMTSPNACYEVNLTITDKGSDDPDKQPSKGTMTFSVSVVGWTDGGDVNETI